MARMILMLQGLQEKIRGSRHLDFPERKWIREMIENDVMDPEVRIKSVTMIQIHTHPVLSDPSFFIDYSVPRISSS